jgi:hypothetical protein
MCAGTLYGLGPLYRYRPGSGRSTAFSAPRLCRGFRSKTPKTAKNQLDRRNNLPQPRFSPHDKTCVHCLLPACGLRRGSNGTSPARTDNPAGRNGSGGKRQHLRSDQTGAAAWNDCSGAHHDWPGRRNAGRQACKVRWRVVSPGRRRSGNPGTHARCRQYAGDPAARQPRRQSQFEAEITVQSSDLARQAGFA